MACFDKRKVGLKCAKFYVKIVQTVMERMLKHYQTFE